MVTRNRSPETSARALLGDLLRAARTQGGYKTQEDLAAELGMDRTGVSRTEGGDRVPSIRALGEWLGRCEITGLARTAIEGVAALARATSEDAPVKIWFSGYLQAEGIAHTLRLWQPLIFHGLFQTPDYTRALLAAAGASENDIRTQVDLRAQRQLILSRSHPPNVISLIDQTILNRLVGTPDVMREVLTGLLEASERFVIQVVPSHIGANAGLGGAISLLTATSNPEVLLSEALVEDQVTTDVSAVLIASATFDRVRGDAASRAESRTFIREALERWNSE